LVLSVVIPVFTILKNYLSDFEEGFIIDFQKVIHQHDWFIYFCNLFYQIFDSWYIDAFFIVLFYSTDSLIAFKIMLLYGLGMYLQILIKYIYQEPHPFWLNKQITISNWFCNIGIPFDYSLPNSQLFILQFMWTNLVYNFLYKYYSEKRFSKTVQNLLTAIYILTLLVLQMTSIAFGVSFLY
jgi:hypothetical protein